MKNEYDVVVIGGGHAGAEAAWFASRLGASTALITMRHDAIGRMSCNPAIGGLGKGHIVREIDALGGLMGLAIDRAGIQFRMLNRSKGPAVWAPRAQADRDLYAQALQSLLASARNLDIVEGTVERFLAEDLRESEAPGEGGGENGSGSQRPRKRIRGVALSDGRNLKTNAVVVTTGTFLRALMHTGEAQTEGGRIGEGNATGLSLSLRELGLELGRLKTGTPPRIHRDSVDYSAVEVQPGDDPPTPISFLSDALLQPQVDCWITWTNERVHQRIRANLHRAPMYSGQILSTGPRYCPSIEDKVVRFAEKERHQVFLEPEGYDSERVYCNGISTSLPKDVQDAVVHGIRGLERARIVQYGYAVEYDFIPTHQTRSSLESKKVRGLFLAGQINGTSGYEEAAGQGAVAGINAVRWLRGQEPFVPRRDQAYIGVMIDDLTTKPPTEPYRMFTSRAEYRLILRADNADQRLTPIGWELGTVDDLRWERFRFKMEALASIGGLAARRSLDGVPLPVWMRRPDADVAALAEVIGQVTHRRFCATHLMDALTRAKYAGYVDRQDRQVERFRRLESLRIPEDIDYGAVAGLRTEARDQLRRVNPSTLGQAGRIPGINPPDVTLLWVHICRGRRPLPALSHNA